MLKPRYVLIICGLILFFLVGLCLAVENNIGGSAKLAGKGFSQVADNLGILANPASFEHVKVKLSLSRSELYDIGVIYSYYEGAFHLLPNLRIGLIYESVQDQDKIDYSGYSQQLFALGLAYKANERLKLGINMNHNRIGLFKENIGEGYSYDFGILLGPFKINQSYTNLGLKAENLLASRKYKTNRVETPELIITFGGNIDIGDISCAVDITQDELRFGIEYQVINSLTLRAGLVNGQPTLGIGVLRSPLQIDYAYWLSEVGATHRVGSSIYF
jgi:hypothetical protein